MLFVGGRCCQTELAKSQREKPLQECPRGSMKTNLETRAKAHPKAHAAMANGAPHTKISAVASPWQERPAGCSDVVWRYRSNPIIGRHHMPGVQGVYNSAVAPYRKRHIARSLL